MLLGTASPTMIAVGAIAGLLPDIDISTSPAGRVLPWISSFFESRMPHRSCTHSLVASGAIAVVGYGAALFNPNFLNLAHALSVGYFFGWFADIFTRGGVEMFWPSPVRCVCPGNRNLRLRTGSNAEYFILILLIAIALAVFNINNSGGILTQFNRLIASPSGVQHIFNESGSTHLIKANIKGVRTGDRSKVNGQYLIIQVQGTGFLVQSDDGRIYKASTEPDSQIFLEEITADVGKPAITNIEALTLEDEPIGQAIAVAAILKKALTMGVNQEGLVIDILTTCYKQRGIIQDEPKTWKQPPPTFADVREEIEARIEDGCKESSKLTLKLGYKLLLKRCRIRSK